MKYIFIAGAPGSKWSSVAKNIYFSADIDQSDYDVKKTYSPDGKEILHVGAYFDPGMENHLPESLSTLTKKQAEAIFNVPFSGSGIRIIKSHIFSYQENIEYLREQWPECPIVLVQRSNDSCLGWWVKAGHFDISYPNYKPYYKDLKTMSTLIERQNTGISNAVNNYKYKKPRSNRELSQILGISESSDFQDYSSADIDVYVI